MKPRTLFILALLAVAIGILFVPLDCFSAPPLPRPGQAPVLNAGDVLNPEFPAVPVDAIDQADRVDVPAAPVAMDDAMARALVWAGPAGAGTNAAPVEVQEPGLADRLWPDGIDWIQTAQWAAGIGATIFGGWWAAERADFWENEVDAAPAPSPSPADLAAAQQAADVLDAPPRGGEAVNLVIVGTFLGPAQVLEGRTFTPGLTFLSGQPARAGEILAYLASDGSNRQGGGSWRATYGNEIAINIPDGAYAGLARIQGATIVLSSGVVLRPQSGAAVQVVQP